MAHTDRTKSQRIYYYILTNSNHQPHIIKQLPKIVNKRLSRSSSNEEAFNSSKYSYEKSLKDSGYTNFKLNFIKTSSKIQKETGSGTSFGLIRLSAEQSPQMFEKGSSNYFVTISHPPTSSKKYLTTTQRK